VVITTPAAIAPAVHLLCFMTFSFWLSPILRRFSSPSWLLFSSTRRALWLRNSQDLAVKCKDLLRRAAEKTTQTRREAALKALDAKIKFSTQPKLDALLVTSGITGEAGPPPRDGMERRGGRDEPRGFER